MDTQKLAGILRDVSDLVMEVSRLRQINEQMTYNRDILAQRNAALQMSNEFQAKLLSHICNSLPHDQYKAIIDAYKGGNEVPMRTGEQEDVVTGEPQPTVAAKIGALAAGPGGFDEQKAADWLAGRHAPEEEDAAIKVGYVRIREPDVMRFGEEPGEFQSTPGGLVRNPVEPEEAASAAPERAGPPTPRAGGLVDHRDPQHVRKFEPLPPLDPETAFEPVQVCHHGITTFDASGQLVCSICREPMGAVRLDDDLAVVEQPRTVREQIGYAPQALADTCDHSKWGKMTLDDGATYCSGCHAQVLPS
jgi:hypothetical protein